MALIHLSQGSRVFEASFIEIRDEMFGKESDPSSRKSTVRRRIESIETFQNTHGIELIARIQNGNKTLTGTGCEYQKTRYEWRLLSGLVVAIHKGEPVEIFSEIDRISTIPRTDVQPKPRRTLSPFLQERRDLRTAMTKLSKVGLNQVRRGEDAQRLLERTCKIVSTEVAEYQTTFNEQRAKQRFIVDFERNNNDIKDAIKSTKRQPHQVQGGVRIWSSINHFPPRKGFTELGEIEGKKTTSFAET